ncbi:MAG TPA: SRPBCC family protein [Hyphomicrobiaceae bacterium]|nr:SRPBCC family protein [Hyphomicrobiaceae bacterium]
MSTVITILGVAALAIAGILMVASRRPDTFRVERSAQVAAPIANVYPRIASLRAMNEWNPFVSPDPDIKITYSGPDLGRGAAHTWDGNRHVGAGHIEVIEAEAPAKVVMRLVMVKPIAADNRVEFTLEPSGDGTKVTWAMSGRQPLLAKCMTLFYDCDRMVGGRFEAGLAGLKRIAEGGSRAS